MLCFGFASRLLGGLCALPVFLHSSGAAVAERTARPTAEDASEVSLLADPSAAKDSSRAARAAPTLFAARVAPTLIARTP